MQIEPSGKGTNSNENLMLGIKCLYGYVKYVYRFVRRTKCIWWAIGNNYLHVYMLYAF